MVASQVLLAVCTISVAAAAPQLGSRRTVTTTSREVSSNSDQIVTSVLSALQQPIATAVAEALRGLQTTQTITTTGSRGVGSGRFSATGGASGGSGRFTTTGGASGGRFVSNGAGFSSGSSGSGGRFVSNGAGFSSGSSKFLTAGSSGVTGATVATGSGAVGGGASQSSSDDIFVRPEYNFEYKVSDDGAQTYLSQKEERDGEEVTGSYSYIDANGALVTVNYQAGNMGYTETREVKEGVVEIRPIVYENEEVTAGQVSSAAQIAAAQNAAAERAAAAERNAAAQRAAAERAAATQRAAAAQRAAAQRAATQRAAAQRAAAERAAAQTSSINSNALISQIISAIQPQIGTAVQNALGASRSTTSVTAVSPITSSIGISSLSSSSGQLSGLSSSSGQASGLSSLFGSGGNLVRIATPKFQVEY